MPQPYSVDLRQRVIDAYLADEETIEEIAARFDVGRTTVVKWAALYRETGGVAPREAKPGPPSTVTPKQIAILRKIIARRPDLTYDELTERWNRALGIERHRSTTVRVVIGLGYTLKKRPLPPPSNTPNASKRSEKATRRSSEEQLVGG
jgi:transposase